VVLRFLQEAGLREKEDTIVDLGEIDRVLGHLEGIFIEHEHGQASRAGCRLPSILTNGSGMSVNCRTLRFTKDLPPSYTLSCRCP